MVFKIFAKKIWIFVTLLGPCHTRHFCTQYCNKKILWLLSMVFFYFWQFEMKPNIFFYFELRNKSENMLRFFRLHFSFLFCYFPECSNIVLFILLRESGEEGETENVSAMMGKNKKAKQSRVCNDGGKPNRCPSRFSKWFFSCTTKKNLSKNVFFIKLKQSSNLQVN